MKLWPWEATLEKKLGMGGRVFWELLFYEEACLLYS